VKVLAGITLALAAVSSQAAGAAFADSQVRPAVHNRVILPRPTHRVICLDATHRVVHPAGGWPQRKASCPESVHSR